MSAPRTNLVERGFRGLSRHHRPGSTLRPPLVVTGSEHPMVLSLGNQDILAKFIRTQCSASDSVDTGVYNST